MSAIDVIVVSYNRRDLLLHCCESVTRLDRDLRLVVVDNGSGDDSVDAVRALHPDAELIRMGSNCGFAAAVNRGAAAGDSPLLLLLNSDAGIDAQSLDLLVAAIDSNADVAAAGPMIRGHGGELELSVNRTMSPLNELGFFVAGYLHGSGNGLLSGWFERRYRRARSVRSLTAACLLIRRRAFEQVGGMDERFFLYAEDVDLCRRLRDAGWHLRYVPASRAVHLRGESGAPESTRRTYRRSQMAFYRKHHGPVLESLLRAWLAARYALASVLSAEPRRSEARRMLRWTLGADKPEGR